MFEPKVSLNAFLKLRDEFFELETEQRILKEKFRALCNHMKIETVWENNNCDTMIVQSARPDLILVNGKWEIKK